MEKIHIIPNEFNQSLELQLAYSIKAGFPSPAEDYQHDTLDFNRDFIKCLEASFYGSVDGLTSNSNRITTTIKHLK